MSRTGGEGRSDSEKSQRVIAPNEVVKAERQRRRREEEEWAAKSGPVVSRNRNDPLVHLSHFKDGYPLCWPMDREGDYTGTFNEALVTCEDCIAILAESENT